MRANHTRLSMRRPAGQAPPWVLVLLCVLVVAGAVLSVLLLSAGTRYQWAVMQNTVEAYESFIGEFEGTPEAENAYRRLHELQDDDVWAKAAAAGSMLDLRYYLRIYPDGKHVVEAEDGINKMLADWDWVKKADKVEYYLAFAARFPNHPEAAWLEKRVIDKEMAAIASEDYGEMPQAEAVRLGGEVVNVEVENGTGHELTVRYSGVESKRLVVPVGETGKATLKPGRYEVGATVAGARPFYCRESLAGGEYKLYLVLGKRGDKSAWVFPCPIFRCRWTVAKVRTLLCQRPNIRCCKAAERGHVSARDL